MMSQSDLSNAISDSAGRLGLGARTDLHEPGWTFWELRTLNRHRMVGFLSDYRKSTDTQDLESEIRSAVSRDFKRAWWRGFAYGIVAELQVISCSAKDLEGLVDIYESRKGVLQWVILIASDDRAAVGVHTWMETYLSPVYRDVLQTLAIAGYHLTTAVRQKDGLLNFLTGVAETRGVAFSEFQGNGPN
ncbi:MAG TPA: hypothetical protein VKB67_06700 [Rhizomicrobium sp.]|nr:hypothetical protein [Rhizomicrobium sp.]